jgi:hypothetical protein
VVVLGAAILYGATGQIGRLVGGIGSGLSGLLAGVSTSPSASPSTGPVAGAPTLDTPSSAYTNEPSVDVTGTVPLTILGSTEYTISLYQQLQGQPPVLVRDQVPIPATANFTIAGVHLSKGSNVFTATIVGSSGESPASSPITYVLDTSKPKLTITTPKPDTKVNGATVDIIGKTQANSVILAQNASNHTSATVSADKDGAFTVTVPITPGANAITITATDPASNATATTLNLTRGSGKLTLTLTSSGYSFSSKKGIKLTFTATLTDPDGGPIAGQDVTFTITIAGVPPDIQTRTTDDTGVATVDTSIGPGAADLGIGKQGTVTAVADPTFGHIQRTIVITTAK